MAAMKATIQAVMHAVRLHQYGGPEVLVYEEAPKPQAAAGEVLIRVHAAGVNPLDGKVRAGQMKKSLPFHLPMIPGWDAAGVVENTGPGVSEFKSGDAVYGLLDRSRNGAYAEYAVALVRNLAFKPKSLGFTQAAALPVTALAAWQSLFEWGHLQAGQTVLIHGAGGGVGHMAVQFARWKGAQVVGTAAGRDLDFIKSLGAAMAIDYQSSRFENLVSGVDLVLDVVGGETQERSYSVLKKNGILVSTVGLLFPEEAVRWGVRAHALDVHADGAQLTQIAALIDAGTVKPVINQVLPLTGAAKAHEMIQTGNVRGKIVLKVRGESQESKSG